MKAIRRSAAAGIEQVIRADESYTVREFRARAGLRDFAFRECRQAGLRVIPVGRKRYVLGSDWIEFLRQRAAEG
jgi:hypothetical protein